MARGTEGRPTAHRAEGRPTARAVTRWLGGDAGTVTVEAALALCSLVGVMVLVVAAVSAASAHLRCLDAAREAARLVARGEPDRAREVAAVVGPRGAVVDVRVAGDQVEVRVSAAPIPGLPGLSFAGSAFGVLEPAALLTTGTPADPSPRASRHTGSGSVAFPDAGSVGPPDPEEPP